MPSGAPSDGLSRAARPGGSLEYIQSAREADETARSDKAARRWATIYLIAALEGDGRAGWRPEAGALKWAHVRPALFAHNFASCARAAASPSPSRSQLFTDRRRLNHKSSRLHALELPAGQLMGWRAAAAAASQLGPQHSHWASANHVQPAARCVKPPEERLIGPWQAVGRPSPCRALINE